MRPSRGWWSNVAKNTALDILIGHETMAEILECMTPKQLTVAALRWDGLTDVEIAELLGVSRQAVTDRMDSARSRIIERLPFLAPTLDGRHYLKGRQITDRPDFEGGSP